jgi:toxin ParE1/3/4
MAANAYRLSPLAQTDLEGIWLYTFENWSAEQADRYLRDIISAFDLIVRDQHKGRRVDARDGYFKHSVKSHFIYYKRNDRGVDIIRVLHQRMDHQRHL